MKFYDQGGATDGFEAGIRMALQAMLASPQFLFRVERTPAGVTARAAYRVATSTSPRGSRSSSGARCPTPSCSRAAGGALSTPAGLDKQVRDARRPARRGLSAPGSRRSGCACRTSTRCGPTRFFP
jgi:hypothetical protein